MALIANLLCIVLSRMIRRHVSFSQIVTMLRLTLMYYTVFISFIENAQNDEYVILVDRAKSPLPNLHYLIRGAYFLKKKARSLIIKAFGRDFYAVLK